MAGVYMLKIPQSFIESLSTISPQEFIKEIKSFDEKLPRKCINMINEVAPIDLYCYFYARFGPANGIQNLLRRDDSDNVIHWEWTFSCEFGFITFQGGNFRTDIYCIGDFPQVFDQNEQLIDLLRAEFLKYKTDMSSIRMKLEHWTEFVNPYWRLKRSIDQLLKELDLLALDKDLGETFLSLLSLHQENGKWIELSNSYSKAFGMCFGVRSMLPVLAEAFVNLIIFVLVRSDIRKDKRLYENFIRQPIDVRIKLLHINCIGFEQAIDYSHNSCRKYHSLVNERNDLLHGNVLPEKQSFNEVYFSGRVPIFKNYRTLWERTISVDSQTVGLERIYNEVTIVENFIEYVLSCLVPETKDLIQRILKQRDLAKNHENGRTGILFPNHLVDFYYSAENEDTA